MLVSLHFIEFAEESIVNRLWVVQFLSTNIIIHQGQGNEQVYHPHPQYYRVPSNVDYRGRISHRENEFQGVVKISDYCGPHVLLLIDLQIFKRSADPGIESLELSVR